MNRPVLLCCLLTIACAGGGKSGTEPEPPVATTPVPAPAPAEEGGDPSGEWVETFEIAMMGYDDEAACTADQGKWSAEQGCIFPAESVARIGPREGDAWPIAIDIVATNAHTCTFEGTTRREGDHFVATAPSEIYVPGENGAPGEMKPAECKVDVRVTPEGLTLEATDYDSCRHFCGARAHLAMTNAQRRAPTPRPDPL